MRTDDKPADRRTLALAIGLTLLIAPRVSADDAARPPDGTQRAIDFLVREVPAWPQQNRCCSCHNNGDGARALLVAQQRGWEVQDAALDETRDWLLHPERWETTGGNPDYGDRHLINAQFGGALALLVESDPAATDALAKGAEVLAELQFEDGSWAFEAEGQIGSPIGYGRALMTVMARDVLIRANRERYGPNIAAAETWLRGAEPRSVLDAAAVLLGLAGASDVAGESSIARRLELLRSAQSKSGGWGPYRIGAPEPFDTAVVLLALQRLPASDELRAIIARGREYLLATQLPDGSWRATTRPLGQESYPQMISTAAWATLALLLTEPPHGSPKGLGVTP